MKEFHCGSMILVKSKISLLYCMFYYINSQVVKCKYNIVRNGDVKHLCDDNCFKRFRGNPTTYLKQAETKDEKVKTCPTIQPKENNAPASNAKPVVTSKSETNQPPPLSQVIRLKM